MNDLDLETNDERRSDLGSHVPLGVMFDRGQAAKELPELVSSLEALPIERLWFVEDVGWAGAVAMAATALAVSTRLPVGIGISPVALRNPVLYAMEIASLASLHEGRLIAGLGHGSRHRLDAVVTPPRSPLGLLRDTYTVVDRLLDGESVSMKTPNLRLDDIALVSPPPSSPELYLGVVSPKSLALSGELADGTILAEGTTPQILTRDLGHIRAGQTRREVPKPHKVVVYIHLLVSSDDQFVAAETGPIIERFSAMHRAEPSAECVAAGPVKVVAERLDNLWQAGADSVVLRPIGDNPVHQVRQVLELLHG